MLLRKMPLPSLVTRSDIGKQDEGQVAINVRTVGQIPKRKGKTNDKFHKLTCKLFNFRLVVPIYACRNLYKFTEKSTNIISTFTVILLVNLREYHGSN